MQDRRVIAGLDVGTSKVCAIIAEVGPNNHLNIIGVGASPSYGLRKGMVVDLDKTAAAISQAVERAERMAGVRMASAFVGVAGGHISSLNSHGVVAVGRPDHEITPQDVQRVMDAARTEFPADRELVHVLPREFVVDGCDGVKDPVGMAGFRLEAHVHVVTGAVTAMQNLVKCVQNAGVQVAQIVLQPLASSEAVLTTEEKNGGTVLVDIGGGTTDVAVFHDGSVWHTAVIPVGGNHFTQDIAYGLRVSREKAEELKLAYTTLGHAVETTARGEVAAALDRFPRRGVGEGVERQMDLIVRARSEELMNLVRVELERAKHPSYIPTCAVLTGGSSQLSGLGDVAKRILDLPVRIGAPRGIGGLADVVASPAYATGVGLAIFGLEHETRRPVQSEPPVSGFFSEILATVRGWFSDFFPQD